MNIDPLRLLSSSFAQGKNLNRFAVPGVSFKQVGCALDVPPNQHANEVL
jgi:hypothetical protein